MGHPSLGHPSLQEEQAMPSAVPDTNVDRFDPSLSGHLSDKEGWAMAPDIADMGAGLRVMDQVDQSQCGHPSVDEDRAKTAGKAATNADKCHQHVGQLNDKGGSLARDRRSAPACQGNSNPATSNDDSDVLDAISFSAALFSEAHGKLGFEPVIFDATGFFAKPAGEYLKVHETVEFVIQQDQSQRSSPRMCPKLVEGAKAAGDEAGSKIMM
eukprot:874569-Karenia_brevis.AAC.1